MTRKVPGILSSSSNVIMVDWVYCYLRCGRIPTPKVLILLMAGWPSFCSPSSKEMGFKIHCTEITRIVSSWCCFYSAPSLLDLGVICTQQTSNCIVASRVVCIRLNIYLNCRTSANRIYYIVFNSGRFVRFAESYLEVQASTWPQVWISRSDRSDLHHQGIDRSKILLLVVVHVPILELMSPTRCFIFV